MSSRTESIKLGWKQPQKIESLASNKKVLPSIKFSDDWVGVYRIFAPGRNIGRMCAEDPTGTIYIGRAGSEKGWSIIRNRLQKIAKRSHHAIHGWSLNDLVQTTYPWSSLEVEWALTPPFTNHLGEMKPGSQRAESWLLSCYRDSFGELPPLNEKG